MTDSDLKTISLYFTVELSTCSDTPKILSLYRNFATQFLHKVPLFLAKATARSCDAKFCARDACPTLFKKRDVNSSQGRATPSPGMLKLCGEPNTSHHQTWIMIGQPGLTMTHNSVCENAYRLYCMRTCCTVCVQAVLYAYRLYRMHAGCTVSVQAVLYANRLYCMHTGCTICVKAVPYAYRLYRMHTFCTVCVQAVP